MEQVVQSQDQIATLKENKIIGNFQFENSKVTFMGKGNILIAPETANGIVLKNSEITFNNDNSVIFLNPNRVYVVGILVHNNSFCYIGKNNFFNGRLNLQCSVQCNIIIGDECLFSFGIWVRTSDVHLIYDSFSHDRINVSKSIFIGDHVWVGQDAKILKGTQMGSGSILGAGSIAARKTIQSNSIWAGNPARLIRENIFFLNPSSHPFTDIDTARWSNCKDDKFIYNFDPDNGLDFMELEKKVVSLPGADARADFLLSFSTKNHKNRFFIGPLVKSEQ